MAKTFGLTGTALESAVPEVIDVDQWMRYYAVLTLFEIGDTYTFGNPHNINFYARPADGRLVALPYDWDFFFANGDTSPLWGNQNLGKIVSRPVFARLLYGHLHDLLRDTFTREYLGTYVTNFGTVAGQSFTTYLSRIRARGQHVRGRLPAAVPFEITTNGGADLAVSTPEVVLEGRGWVDVREVRVEGLGPLTLRWLDLSRWRATVPLVSTRQTLRLEAFDHRGGKVGEDSIGIVTDRVDDAQRRYLRLCEIHYHPSDVTDAERAAGWVEDDFEFLEIANFGPIGVSLAGMRVDGGIRYAFAPEGAPVLEPGRSVVLARNADAFSVRYGPGVTALGVYEGSLDNAGERLLLIDRQGIPVHEVVYDDEPPWPTAPDGSGPSLEWIAPGGEETGGPADWGTGSVGGSPGVAPKVAVRPRILGIARVPDNRVRVEFVGRPGAIHRIQTRSSLSDGAWSDTETTVTPAPDGRAAWESSGATAEGYFRVATE
ncbi:MAG: CotH kinase family protein [Verrucomicrobiales bacterium]|nr:CotH kinase family protein [Verrucomicrobiales bacterium]